VRIHIFYFFILNVYRHIRMTDTTFADQIQPASGATFDVNGITFSNVAPTANQVFTATSASAAEWQTGVSALKTTGAPVVVTSTSPPSVADIFFASSATTGEWGSFSESNLNRVRVATTTAGTLASDFENGDTIDGVVLVTGDRILIKDQSTGTENGIYVVEATGAPTRASDFISGENVSTKFFWAAEGNANANNGFVVTNAPGSDVVGTDTIIFRIFSNSETNLTVASSLALTVAITNGVNDITILPGIYEIDSSLVVSDNTIIRGSGNTNTILRAVDPLTAPIISINNVSEIKIQDLQLDGNESSVTTPDNLIEVTGATTSNITIKNCNLVNSGTSVSNIEVSGVTGLKIEECLFNGAGNLGDHINVNAGTNTIDRLAIKNCRFANLAAAKLNINIVGLNFGQGLIEACIFGTTTGNAISISNSGQLVINNCIFDTVTGSSTISTEVTTLIKNCHFEGCSTVTDFSPSASNLSIVGNLFNNATGDAITIFGNQTIITGNVIENSTLFGINMIVFAENGLIQSNILRNNGSGNISVNVGIGNKYTRVIENNSFTQSVLANGSSFNGYDDIIRTEPAAASPVGITLPDLNFGSAGHILVIEYTESVAGYDMDVTPTTAGTRYDTGAAYTSIQFNDIGDYAVFQWTISGTGWNLIDTFGSVVIT